VLEIRHDFRLALLRESSRNALDFNVTRIDVSHLWQPPATIGIQTVSLGVVVAAWHRRIDNLARGGVDCRKLALVIDRQTWPA